MYKGLKSSFYKHLDFVVLDIICMELSFLFAYLLRHNDFVIFLSTDYKSIMFFILFGNIVSFYLFNSMQDVLKRSIQLEFYSTIKTVIFIEFVLVFFLFVAKKSTDYSRQIVVLFPIIYLFFTFIVRLVYKSLLKRILINVPKRKLVIITTIDKILEILSKYDKNISELNIDGFIIIDEDLCDKYIIFNKLKNCFDICDIKNDNQTCYKIVSNKILLIDYLLKNNVDEVMISINSQNEYKRELIKKITEMGIVLHIEVDYIDSIVGQNNKQFIEDIFDYTVITSTTNTITPLQFIIKRMIDLVSSIIGCIITILLCIIVGPIIYIKSPGNIFFSQERVGLNGKIFKMFKFRSMYLDAEERKKDLMKLNERKDDLMFKIEDDPRIIKGIGHFVRKYSIDEFPQFFNVLIGDMSLVGTRPPTKDEYEKYEPHHKARLSVKPGITGLWQVSGRSNIKDFEDVVKLDTEYIKNFSIWLDLKIILKTFLVVFTKNGAK